MAFALDFQVEGAEEAARILAKEFPKRLNAALKRAGQQATTILRKAAKENAPKPGKKVPLPGQEEKGNQLGETGLLRKSLTKKVGVVRKTGLVYALVGPDSKVVGKAWNPWIKKMVKVKPSRYAHLVENGFLQKRRVRGRVITQKIAARPFLRKAWDENKDKIQQKVVDVLNEEIAKQQAKA